MRSRHVSSIVALVMVAALGASVWSTCGYAARESAPTQTAAHHDGCPPPKPDAPADPCDVDHRGELGLTSSHAAPTIEKLAPADAPVPVTGAISASLYAFAPLERFERPALKLPHAPVYLLVSVFLI